MKFKVKPGCRVRCLVDDEDCPRVRRGEIYDVETIDDGFGMPIVYLSRNGRDVGGDLRSWA
jgi:hypothetical protein